MRITSFAIVAAFLLAAGSAAAIDLNCSPDALAVTPPALPATHTVMEGENLHLISALYYGHARNWKAIWQANRG